MVHLMTYVPGTHKCDPFTMFYVGLTSCLQFEVNRTSVSALTFCSCVSLIESPSRGYA